MGRFQGGLSSRTATDLGATAIAAAIERSGIGADDVDFAYLGNVVAAGVGVEPFEDAEPLLVLRVGRLRHAVPPALLLLQLTFLPQRDAALGLGHIEAPEIAREGRDRRGEGMGPARN